MANYLRIFLLLIFITTKAFAGDYHQDDAQHVVLYNVTDSSGNHVTGETVRLTMYQVRNNTFFDFDDNTFKALGSVTTLHRTMNENATGGFYFTTVTIDSASLVSSEIVCTISNESASYADTVSEAIYFDKLEQLIKIHR